MSGFKYDIESILKHLAMFHTDSYGLVFPNLSGDGNGVEVLDYLISKGMKISGVLDKDIQSWDFIIIPKESVTIKVLLKSISMLNSGGIIIIEITGKSKKYKDTYKSSIGNLKITKLFYDDRRYLVAHTGDEYGN